MKKCCSRTRGQLCHQSYADMFLSQSSCISFISDIMYRHILHVELCDSIYLSRLPKARIILNLCRQPSMHKIKALELKLCHACLSQSSIPLSFWKTSNLSESPTATQPCSVWLHCRTWSEGFLSPTRPEQLIHNKGARLSGDVPNAAIMVWIGKVTKIKNWTGNFLEDREKS